MLDLVVDRMRNTKGIRDAVGTEVIALVFDTPVTAIRQFAILQQALVLEVPDIAAAILVTSVHDAYMFTDIAAAVAHGVLVLGDDDRMISVFFVRDGF